MKILLINYYWPPCGGPAVQRWLNIMRYFSSKDMACSVITIDEKVATFPSIDLSLLESVPESINVYRTDSSELFNVYKKYIGKGKVPSNGLGDEPNPTFMQKVARFVRGNLFLPDPRKGWNKHAYKQAEEIILKEGIDVIVTAGPPHSTHLVAKQLKKKYDFIWHMDLHDYWYDVWYLNRFYRTKLAASFDKKIMMKCVAAADSITTDCKHYAQDVINENPASKGKVHPHTMGYNEELFLGKGTRTQDKFIITYIGTITEDYNIKGFFSALRSFLDEENNPLFEFRFAGSASPYFTRLINDYGLNDQFVNQGYMKHKDVIELLKQSTVLLLANPQTVDEVRIVPGKIYEYLAARKPIISISAHDSENEWILNECDGGKNFERNEEEEIMNYLTQLYKQWQDNKSLDYAYSDEAAYKKYGRDVESQQLLERFNKLTKAKS